MSETNEVLEVTDCSGETLAVYVQGHVPASEFLSLVRQWGEDYGRDPDELPSNEGEVRHDWWRSEDCDCGDHGEHYVMADPEDPDAYAVTAWHVTDAKWAHCSPETP
jgi:hypothetical protein